MIALAASARALRVFQVVWVLGFLVGTTTHTADLIVGGLNAYSDFPLGVRLFWVSLTILDPATAALIIFRRRSGIVLGIAVIVADIAVNWTVFAVIGGLPLFGVISQSLFAVLILVTARPLWRWFAQYSPRKRADLNREASPPTIARRSRMGR
ncbi:hypothetical protein VD659_18140 [Herbiconiux sp. 11R-BC]|uniref:hypothetical protein n=1 Tax=Herbiconiux sp. 11R-BC TaxID=3111637 RepID=UPI003C0B7983